MTDALLPSLAERYAQLISARAAGQPVAYLIGEREFWSKGYGTDMMKLCQQFVFSELCMERLSLGLHEYNPRALRSYEKCGFRLEGRTRQDLMREGRRASVEDRELAGFGQVQDQIAPAVAADRDRSGLAGQREALGLDRRR